MNRRWAMALVLAMFAVAGCDDEDSRAEAADATVAGDAAPTPTPGDAGPTPTPGDAGPMPTPGDAAPRPEPPPCDGANFSQMNVSPDFEVQSLSVDPQMVNADADLRENVDHYVVLPRASAVRQQLFLFIPGTNSRPSVASNILRVAAFHGYHGIGIAFSNDGSITDQCRAADDVGVCHGEIIAERLYGDGGGDGPSARVSVSPPNSIIERLRDVLQLLHMTSPDDGWDRYLDGDEINWANVVVSGASQGGKTATYLTRDILVARAVLFNAFGTALRGAGDDVVIAPWSLEPRATPPGRVFGLWHEEEAANIYGPLLLQQMGVDQYGGIVDVDGAMPPYDCSHMLRTRVLPSTAENPDDFSDAHPSVGADYATPMDADGTPVLAPVWSYMMTAPVAD